jgi:hypothetical protein
MIGNIVKFLHKIEMLKGTWLALGIALLGNWESSHIPEEKEIYLKHKSHHKDCDEKCGSLKELEVKVHMCAHWPPNDDTKWNLWEGSFMFIKTYLKLQVCK